MDLDYYRHRQQESHVMAQNAACDCSRVVHRKLADAYGLLVANAASATKERPLLRVAAA